MYSYQSTEHVPSQSYEVAKGSQAATEDGGEDRSQSWGTIVIDVRQWSPKGPMDCPPSITRGFSREIAVEFAIAFNGSLQAKKRKRWAVVMANNTVLFLTNIADEDRPTEPTAYPAGVRLCQSRQEADATMLAENRERHSISHVPRSWTVAVGPLHVAERVVSP